MSREEFDLLVRQVESGVGRDGPRLRRRVAFWAIVGYAGFISAFALVPLFAALFLVPASVLGKEGWLLWLAGGITLVIGGWDAGKSLWIRGEPPAGREVKRAEAPALFKMLDELRRQLDSRAFDRVLLVVDYNASVVQTPRLGLLGWWRSDLLVGLPLMDSLSEQQFRAVLAHEFAHHSRQHGRLGHSLYRLRRAWEHVFAKLNQQGAGGTFSLRALLGKFVDWFWPRFNAHAFVYSRACEHEADATAARLVGVHPTASALIRIRVIGRLIDETFWPATWLRVKSEPAPPKDVLHLLTELARREPVASDCTGLVAEALRGTTTNAETHPCLHARLQALGATAGKESRLSWPHADPVRSADTLLRDAAATIRADLQTHWEARCTQAWRERHGKSNALQHRLSALASHESSDHDADALWDKARAVLELEGPAVAEPLLRRVIALRPAHGPAQFCLGRHLLESGDRSGETHLEAAASADEELLPEVCNVLHAHFRAEGDTLRLRGLDARMDKFENARAESHRERGSVTARDSFIAHSLSEEEMAVLRVTLAAQPELHSAFLAQKQLVNFPKQRLFVLCVATAPAWHRFPRRDRDEQLARRVAQAVQLPGRMLVCAPHGSFRPVAKSVRSVPGAAIFRRGPA